MKRAALCYRITLIAVSLICLGLYVPFVLDDLFRLGLPHAQLKLTFMGLLLFTTVLWLLYSFLFRVEKKELMPSVFFIAAMGFTLIADSCLVFDAHITFGVIVFAFAQFFHSLHILLLGEASPKYMLISMLVKLGLGLVVFALTQLKMQPDALSFFASFYAVFLCTNAAESFFFAWHCSQNRARLVLLGIGFIFFIGCDIFVAMRFLGAKEAQKFMWLCYGPSQVLIVSSGYPINFLESYNNKNQVQQEGQL